MTDFKIKDIVYIIDTKSDVIIQAIVIDKGYKITKHRSVMLYSLYMYEEVDKDGNFIALIPSNYGIICQSNVIYSTPMEAYKALLKQQKKEKTYQMYKDKIKTIDDLITFPIKYGNYFSQADFYKQAVKAYKDRAKELVATLIKEKEN